MNKYIAEAIGTFALVFCGTGAIIIDGVSGGALGTVGIAITFGLIVMAMIAAVGEVSGAHFNPAVTIGFWVSKRFEGNEVLPYITAQAIGAFFASGVLRFLFPDTLTMGETLPAGPWLQTFVFEIILTFFLMFVIIHVATGSKEQGIIASIAIGAIVLLEALFAGPITGASMNPIRSIAPAIVNMNLEHLWMYIVAPILGSVLAVFSWKLIHPET
ncbi:aquaporin [Saprospiraceae bacterium]|jgi:aquaporin NIP|nr:aquaporin [Saprospiraceae bacterium]MDA9301385.1 aquaporin [bacterium]HAV30168.1 aquaporin [Saprospirales bacterium]MDA9873499.1 aquaporin [Saprospiraceae bacterium]MDC1284230.1 aquaporin [Saprospiraceae bacterium]